MHRYPLPGFVVEYMESNTPQVAVVLEGDENRLRLLLPNRRELKLSTNRILPWQGPQINLSSSREEIVRILMEHKNTREKLAANISVLEAWEMAQGEITEAPASWFAELFDSNPDENTVAAFGRALLNFKSHFRFQFPNFQIYTLETVEKRLAEEKAKKEKEALIEGGNLFLRHLWNIAQKHGSSPDQKELPDEAITRRIFSLLMTRVIDEDSQNDVTLWQSLVKGLPEVPYLPLQLLMAWGKLPPHYNFWLDRADYERGDSWWKSCEAEVNSLKDKADTLSGAFIPCSLPFISIDGASTKDIDDAFYAKITENGFSVTIALACPALDWNFAGELDKLVKKRGTSIYLPEGDLHMLPQILGLETYSLLANQERPALCIELELDNSGNITNINPFLAKIALAANLLYSDVEKVLTEKSPGENPAAKFFQILQTGNQIAEIRKKTRIERGAIIMDRPEPELSINGEGWDTIVELKEEEEVKLSKALVAELMIVASAAMGQWAQDNKIPLLHRTQDVALPKEYAGEWHKPEDLAKIIKILTPSILEVEPRKHAALGVSNYVPITSPLRRYSDLVNEYQLVNWLINGQPYFDKPELEKILGSLAISLEGAAHAQRYRPRYWKLLYAQQQGTQVWWPGIITEENELYITVNFPQLGLFVRAKRHLFSDRAAPGIKVNARLGKINPLYNEIQIIEVDTPE